ncbi:MAG: rRNA maturation RNase YbeY [Campylobacterota bacterium]|nr:rRNA maturation RNase YbeY [Campylobacterota bacterium]
MIDYENLSVSSYSLEKLELITKSLTKSDVELTLTCNDDIAKINAEFRHINTPTDVLSFPNEPMPMAPLGSIMISDDYVKKVSSELGHSAQDEFTLLYIHGLLHLLGYDHEVDSGEMREKEENLIKTYGLPQSLIVRTQKED